MNGFHLNYLAVVVSGVAAFVFAAIYYSLLARQRARLSAAAGRGRPPAWLMVLELVKAIAVAVAVAVLATLIGIQDVPGALALALGLWFAFPVILLLGSITQEGVPWKLGAIHGGDWLAKLLIVSLVTTAWR